MKISIKFFYLIVFSCYHLTAMEKSRAAVNDLSVACVSCDLTKIKQLVQKNPSVINIPDIDGATPLTNVLTFHAGHEAHACATYLLNNHATISQVYKNDPDELEGLMAEGKNVPWLAKLWKEHKNNILNGTPIKCFARTLSAPAGIQYAAAAQLSTACTNADLDEIKHIIKLHPYAINIIDAHGYRPLDYVYRAHKYPFEQDAAECVTFLTNKGAINTEKLVDEWQAEQALAGN